VRLNQLGQKPAKFFGDGPLAVISWGLALKYFVVFCSSSLDDEGAFSPEPPIGTLLA
jgi:hypothetical protein